MAGTLAFVGLFYCFYMQNTETMIYRAVGKKALSGWIACHSM